MPLMDQNFVFLLAKCSMGNLTGDEKIDTSGKVSGCVIATSRGLPNAYKTGFPIKIEILKQMIVKFSTLGLL